MNYVQTDLSDEALVTAIRTNLCDFFRHLSRSIPEKHFENGKFMRWYTPLPHPWFNGVLSANQPEENDEAFIEETIQHFRAKGVKIFTWWMEPHLTRSDWGPILSKYGFEFSDDTPGMALDLQELDSASQTINGFEIRRVNDQESLQEWVEVFIDGFNLPSNWKPGTFDVWMQIGLGFPMGNYLGYLNGKPVSTSAIFYGGGVAGIYCVATLPEARGRGIGLALTHQPLREAYEMGYNIGVLQSSKMGFNIYKKLGFRHLCQIESFSRSLR